MTVAELIAQLQPFPPEAPITVAAPDDEGVLVDFSLWDRLRADPQLDEGGRVVGVLLVAEEEEGADDGGIEKAPVARDGAAVPGRWWRCARHGHRAYAAAGDEVPVCPRCDETMRPTS